MSEGDRAVIPLLDTPIQVASPFESKETLERVQLEKYRLDHLLRFGEVPFEDVRRGANPPDFLVTRGGSTHAIDCASLALERKRQAEALFTKLLHKVANGNISLQHLAETNVIIWFGHGADLPPRVNDAPTAQDLIEALEQTHVDRDQIARINAELSEHGFPQQLPRDVLDGLSVVNNERFGFQVVPLEGWHPQDRLSAQLGFSISLSLPLMIQDVNLEMQRLVSKHDNGRIQHLLVAIGGPDRNGICFPAEHELSLWFTEDPVEPVSAEHITRVTAHTWQTGQLIEIPVRTQ